MVEVFLGLLLWVQEVPEDEFVVSLAAGDCALTIAGSDDAVDLALVEHLLLGSRSSGEEIGLSFEGPDWLETLVEEADCTVEPNDEHAGAIVPEEWRQGCYVSLESNFLDELEGAVAPHFDSAVIGPSSKHIFVNKCKTIDASPVCRRNGLRMVNTAKLHWLLGVDAKTTPIHRANKLLAREQLFKLVLACIIQPAATAPTQLPSLLCQLGLNVGSQNCRCLLTLETCQLLLGNTRRRVEDPRFRA